MNDIYKTYIEEVKNSGLVIFDEIIHEYFILENEDYYEEDENFNENEKYIEDSEN